MRMIKKHTLLRLSSISSTSPQTVSNGAVYLYKIHCILHNVLIINAYKFLQRGRVLNAEPLVTES